MATDTTRPGVSGGGQPGKQSGAPGGSGSPPASQSAQITPSVTANSAALRVPKTPEPPSFGQRPPNPIKAAADKTEDKQLGPLATPGQSKGNGQSPSPSSAENASTEPRVIRAGAVKIPVIATVTDEVRKDLIKYHNQDARGFEKVAVISDKAMAKQSVLMDMTVKLSAPSATDKHAYARELQRVAPDVFKRIAPPEVKANLASEKKVDGMFAKANADITPYAAGKAKAAESRARNNDTMGVVQMASMQALVAKAAAPQQAKAPAAADKPRARSRGM